jgi:hypothetical protein
MRATLIASIILLMGFLALPFAVDTALEQQLSSRLGPTRIDSVALNLFTGRARVTGIAIDGVGGSDLSLASIDIDVGMLELLRGKLLVERLAGNGLQLIIEQDAEGNAVVLLVLRPATEQADAATAAIPVFRLAELSISDSTVDVRTQWAQGQLELKQLTLRNLSSDAAGSADLTLQASWGDTALSWQGQLQPFAQTPSFSGNLLLKQLKLAEISPALPLAQRHLELDGELDLELELRASFSDSIAVTIRGDAEARQLSLRHPDQAFDLARIASLSIKGLSVDPDGSVSVASLNIQQAFSLQDDQRDEQLFSAGNITITKLQHRDATLELDHFDADQLRSVLRVNPAGELQTIGVLSATLDALSQAEENLVQEDGSGSTFHYAIARFTAQDSLLQFYDQRFQPAVNVDIAIDDFLLTDLDSRTSSTPGELMLRGKLGKYGKISLDGELAPLAQPLAFNLDGELDGASLISASPYLEKMLGYEIRTGQYDHVFRASLNDNLLDSSNQLKLRELKLKKLKDAKPDAPLPIPLDMALGLLRDSDGTIELDVPVKGRLDDPQVGTEQIISKALGKALTSGSTAMLKFALQPYGAIWSGAEMGLKFATTIRLDPMTFTPGSAQLDNMQRDYAGKIADLLVSKPELQLTLCGIAGSDDVQWLQQQGPDAAASISLEAIAEQRQHALMNFLVEERQLEPKRLFPCQPRVAAKNSISGIELGL